MDRGVSVVKTDLNVPGNGVSRRNPLTMPSIIPYPYPISLISWTFNKKLSKF